ncbi:MAG: hypothetical protein ACREH8_09385 [Opitutaceae bacterium]
MHIPIKVYVKSNAYWRRQRFFASGSLLRGALRLKEISSVAAAPPRVSRNRRRKIARRAEFRVVVLNTRTPVQARNIVLTIPGRDRTRPSVVVMTPRSLWWESTSERGGGLVVLAGDNADAEVEAAGVRRRVYGEHRPRNRPHRPG